MRWALDRSEASWWQVCVGAVRERYQESWLDLQLIKGRRKSKRAQRHRYKRWYREHSSHLTFHRYHPRSLRFFLSITRKAKLSLTPILVPRLTRKRKGLCHTGRKMHRIKVTGTAGMCMVALWGWSLVISGEFHSFQALNIKVPGRCDELEIGWKKSIVVLLNFFFYCTVFYKQQRTGSPKRTYVIRADHDHEQRIWITPTNTKRSHAPSRLFKLLVDTGARRHTHYICELHTYVLQRRCVG